jgi:hypothetical protein
MDVIDLTLSDSDDDDEPQLKGPYVAPPLPRPAGPGLATPRSPGTSASGTGGQAGGFTTQEMVEKGVAVAIRVAEAQEQARKRGREIDEADRAGESQHVSLCRLMSLTHPLCSGGRARKEEAQGK